MRHLRSILYALVLAPAVWILCGVGFDQDLTGRARDNGGIESLGGMLLLLLAGAAYAILLFSPISPAGPLLAGLAFAGVGAWARIAPESYAAIWPAEVVKDGFNVSTPGYGLAVLLTVPLICTALSARRWAAFEPPQILLLGTIGRARGAATVAGTSMAAERTAVLPHQQRGSGLPQPGSPQWGYPQQGYPQPSPGSPRRAPGVPAPSADTTQIVSHADPTVAIPAPDDDRTTAVPVSRADEPTTLVPVDDGDEKAIVMQLGPAQARPAPVSAAPAAPVPSSAGTVSAAPASSAPTSADPVSAAPVGPARFTMEGDDAADEPTRIGTPSRAVAPTEEAATEALAQEEATRDVTADDETTRNVTAADEITQSAVTADERNAIAADETVRNVVTAEDTTRVVVATEEGEQSQGGEPTQVVTFDDRTEFVVASSDGEKTQVLRLPTATDGERVDGSAKHGEPTQVIRVGMVEPPGDRTQLLTFPAPGEAATVASPAGEQTRESTKSMSIVGEERPAPGADPTTRLIPPGDLTPAAQQQGPRAPGAETTRPNNDRRAMTVTSLERPADEAADDTRPLVLPAQRQPAEDDATRRL